MVGPRREKATRRLSKAAVLRLRGLIRHRAIETTEPDPGLPTIPDTTSTVTRTPTAAPRRAGVTLLPGQEVTEAESTGPVVRRGR